jgi:hypothetical protein
MTRDRSLAIGRHSYRLRYIVEWLKDHVAAIGPLNLNLEICGRSWIN